MSAALTHTSGWLAMASLLASLGLSLAARGLSEHRARLVAFRRLAGLLGAAASLAHASLALVAVLGLASLEEASAIVGAVPYLRHGALALALLAVLALTSFPELNARLGLRTWSTLHRGVYVAAALAALHVLAGPSADPRLALAVTVVVGLLLLARLARRGSRASEEARGLQPPDDT